MKKPSSKIRTEIAKLQEALRQAETREAERIGRVALKAGLGEIEIDDAELQAAFEDLEKRFREGQGSIGRDRPTTGGTVTAGTPRLAPGTGQGGPEEA